MNQGGRALRLRKYIKEGMRKESQGGGLTKKRSRMETRATRGGTVSHVAHVLPSVLVPIGVKNSSMLSALLRRSVPRLPKLLWLFVLHLSLLILSQTRCKKLANPETSFGGRKE